VLPMTISEMMNIGLMQGFAGLSLFAVLLLMGLGLAIIFGQMGVINMAHGEFMTIGAYTIYLGSTLTATHAPQLVPYYFPLAIIAAFGFAFVAGWLVEWGLIRHLYKRPLDTLLATWGVSLALQQCFRTFIGPKEVSPTLPDWLLGSWAPAEGLDIPINGLFVLGLTAVVTCGILLALHRSRWGLRVRATVSNRIMANAIGIDTQKTDRLTFAIGCGIAGVAGAAFTTIGSTGPTSGSLYIVDAFLVVTFGGAAIIVLILMMRPQGLFASKVRR
jgi:urea transport system permease protein